MPLTSAPTDGGTLVLLACWFIRGLLVCATMMWSWSDPRNGESGNSSFPVCWCMSRWLASPRRPGAHQRYADTWPAANARTQCQQITPLRPAGGPEVCLLIGVDRKSSAEGETGAFDPFR